MSEREQEARRRRLEALRGAGVDPFPARTGPRVPVAQVRDRFDAMDAEALEAAAESVAVCGRILAQRSFGKLVFLTLLDEGARIQVTARKQELDPEVFAFVKALDVGDFARFEGRVWRTQKGELSVDVASAELLAKALRPLPEKWHGLKDVEMRYRQRTLDLLVNEDARRIAVLRSRTIRALRSFLDARGFLEVETPVLQPLYGGAAALPFETHHATYDQKLYLRISDELYLKRLVAGGLDRVYEIGHNFRNEGVSRKHNPEFTMLECYRAYADYRDMMELTEAMIESIAREVRGDTRIEFRGEKIDLKGPWPRVTLRDAIAEATGVDVLETDDLEGLRQAVRARGLDPGEAPTWAKLVDDLFSAHVEPGLVQPTFVTDYPWELSPLAKRSAEEPRLVERFEPFLAGMEIGNAFSELNDPDDQRQRLEAQAGARRAGDAEAHPLDEDYIRTLEYGLPPTGGLGVGVDRLVMVLSDAAHIREVILFPHLRPEVNPRDDG
ncbi:MAG: lysine--tRNA ligase [Myxococcota bacterium]|nr:lysine--tRNA ligase [Deltaproteobacteria bacterium]MCP4244949.1 lysine--tRNA ligase [bacterium]MDP6076203.1 lysine--tRNA ligase [Myxococcota bacterium]MDP6242231.1 lysine--tRNA ligase [Myxococcota bacterium]MDP7074909.1 lysine--tRNA ligase [Myxococcota bacterium]